MKDGYTQIMWTQSGAVERISANSFWRVVMMKEEEEEEEREEEEEEEEKKEEEKK